MTSRGRGRTGAVDPQPSEDRRSTRRRRVTASTRRGDNQQNSGVDDEWSSNSGMQSHSFRGSIAGENVGPNDDWSLGAMEQFFPTQTQPQVGQIFPTQPQSQEIPFFPTQPQQTFNTSNNSFEESSSTNPQPTVPNVEVFGGSISGDEWNVTTPMPGGPFDPYVIPSYGGHVARDLWDGIDRGVIGSYTRPDVCKRLQDVFQRLHPDAKLVVEQSGLGHLPALLYSELDMPLISAFVERWQPDTNSFHLPFGEMTILLHDVWYILGIPVDGELPYDNPCNIRRPGMTALDKIARLFGYENVLMFKKNNNVFLKGGVDQQKLMNICDDQQMEPLRQALAWLHASIGICLFTDKYRTHVKCHYFDRCYPDKVGTTSWGAMTLAFLYRQLGMASRRECCGIAGCLTLLQAWIYEHFHCFRPCRDKKPIGPLDPRASAWRVHKEKNSLQRLVYLRSKLDSLRADEVTWCPYVNNPLTACPRTSFHGCLGFYDIMEPYMPDRCIRQIGYVQKIPLPALLPETVVRSAKVAQYLLKWPLSYNQDWVFYERRNRLISEFYQQADHPSETTDNYLQWYLPRTHPRITSGEGNDETGPSEPPSADWWVHEIYRVSRPLLSMKPEQFGEHAQDWRNYQDVLQRFANWSGFSD